MSSFSHLIRHTCSKTLPEDGTYPPQLGLRDAKNKNGNRSKGTGRGTEIFLPSPRLRKEADSKTARGKKLGLSRSLAWIQEKNFEDKFEVVKVIGCVPASDVVLLLCLSAYLAV